MMAKFQLQGNEHYLSFGGFMALFMLLLLVPYFSATALVLLLLLILITMGILGILLRLVKRNGNQ